MVLADFITKADDTIKYTVNLGDVIEQMYAHRLEYIVLLRDKKPFGIFTKTDILRLLHKKTNLDSPASPLSNKNLITFPNNSSLGYAHNQILSFDMDYFIVTDENDDFAGVIAKEIFLSNPKIDQKKFTKRVSDIAKAPTHFISLPFHFMKY